MSAFISAQCLAGHWREGPTECVFQTCTSFLHCYKTSGIGQLPSSYILERGWQQIDVLTVALSKSNKGKKKYTYGQQVISGLVWRLC